MSEPSAIFIEDLTVYYDKNPVLWEIELAIPSGNLVGIIGPNGAGKSTLLKAMLGIVPRSSGKVQFFSKSYKEMQKRIAYVPQRESVDWDFPIRVIDVALMGMYGKIGLFKRISKEDRARAYNLLEEMGLAPFATRQISQLSGGQQQRLFLTRALMQEADIYLLDEPFAGVDMTSEAVIMDKLRDLRKKGKTILVVHHDLGSVARYFDWMVMLNRRVTACGEVSTVFSRENIQLTYGNKGALLEEVIRSNEQKSRL